MSRWTDISPGETKTLKRIGKILLELLAIVVIALAVRATLEVIFDVDLSSAAIHKVLRR